MGKMKAAELRTKNADELNRELIGLRREQFNLRMQRGAGQLANPMRFNAVRRDIARIKTILTEKAGEKTEGKAKEVVKAKNKVATKAKSTDDAKEKTGAE